MNHHKFNDIGRQRAEDIVTSINIMGGKARIGETYMDYGAGITWETILVHHKGLDMEYQALSPRDFDDLNNGMLASDKVKEIIDMAIGRK